jgi:hypothetical protein
VRAKIHRPPPRITDGGCKACKASVPDTANARGTENIHDRAMSLRYVTAGSAPWRRKARAQP